MATRNEVQQLKHMAAKKALSADQMAFLESIKCEVYPEKGSLITGTMNPVSDEDVAKADQLLQSIGLELHHIRLTKYQKPAQWWKETDKSQCTVSLAPLSYQRQAVRSFKRIRLAEWLIRGKKTYCFFAVQRSILAKKKTYCFQWALIITPI